MIEKKISQFIEGQFPELYRTDGEIFILFVTAYYQWLEETDNVNYVTRRLLEYRDVDSTVDEFLLYFKEKYLKNIQFETETDKKLLIKNSLNLYRSKGSERSIELFFRLVYGLGSDIYYPGDDVFKTSDNDWIVPRFIEVQDTPRTKALVGKQITGLSSGATAFAERFIRRKTKSDQYKNLLYLTNIVGEFEMYEAVIYDVLYDNSPIILGSPSFVQILSGGTEFTKGDSVIIESAYSNNSIGRVSSVVPPNSNVYFSFVSGGYGYTVNAVPVVSSGTLLLEDYRTTATYHSFLEYGTERLSNVQFTDASNTFSVGDYVYSTSGGEGLVIDVSQTGANGYLVVSRANDNFVNTDDIFTTSNVIVANNITSTNIDAVIKTLERNEKLKIITSIDISDRVVNYDTITQNQASARIYAISGKTLYIDEIEGVFDPDLPFIVDRNNQSVPISRIDVEVKFQTISGNLFTNNSPTLYFDGGSYGTVEENSTATTIAQFELGEISNTEVVSINTDYLRDYANVALDANTYGFPGNTSGNSYNMVIKNMLTYGTYEIGFIDMINNTQQGVGYDIAPKAVVLEQPIENFEKFDYKFYMESDATGYVVGERVYQNTEIPYQDLLLASVSGLAVGYKVWQVPDISGYITEINGNVIKLANTTGTFSANLNIYYPYFPIWGNTRKTLSNLSISAVGDLEAGATFDKTSYTFDMTTLTMDKTT